LGAAAVLFFLCIRTYSQVFVWENTVTLYSHAVKVTGKNAFIHHSLGVAYYQEKEFDAALKQFQTALEINPTYIDAANNLGAALLAKGDFNEAERIFRRILKAGHDRQMAYTAHSNLGILFARQGRDREAIEALTRAIELQPDVPEAYHRVGLIFMRRKNRTAAQKFFQFAIEVDPSFAPARKSLVRLREIDDRQP
jgi:Tfp pilus assembly protein PilF